MPSPVASLRTSLPSGLSDEIRPAKQLQDGCVVCAHCGKKTSTLMQLVIKYEEPVRRAEPVRPGFPWAEAQSWAIRAWNESPERFAQILSELPGLLDFEVETDEVKHETVQSARPDDRQDAKD